MAGFLAYRVGRMDKGSAAGDPFDDGLGVRGFVIRSLRD
jgi:hypothetical protein